MSNNKQKQQWQIFDKLFKRSMHLSNNAVLNFINGLYDQEYNIEHDKLMYVSTEYVTSNYKKEFSDIVIMVNNKEKYHMECQIQDDKTMSIRVFEYGYLNAKDDMISNDETITLEFASPKVIYLEHTAKTPDQLQLILNFQGQGTFTYEIGTLKLTQKTIEEIFQERLIILIPFTLLKMRKTLSKSIPIEKQEQVVAEFELLTQLSHQ